MIFIGSLLFVIGLPGMYLRQAGRAGVLGLVGFILLFFAMLLAGAVFIGVQVIVFPSLAQKAPQLIGPTNTPGGAVLLLLISGLMLSIGPVVLGISAQMDRGSTAAPVVFIATTTGAVLRVRGGKKKGRNPQPTVHG